MSERIALKLLDLGIERDDAVSIQLPSSTGPSVSSVTEMPLTPSGKIQKFVLREQLAQEVGARLFENA